MHFNIFVALLIISAQILFNDGAEEPPTTKLDNISFRHSIKKRGFDDRQEEDVLTHLDWLPINERSYKIYNEKLSFDAAMRSCPYFHSESTLAAVTTLQDAKTLGQYLRTGMPRLTSAWIGARWTNGGYSFVSDKISLESTTTSSGFPPWKFNTTRSEGCVLLVQSRTAAYFMEANCDTPRPYICNIKNGSGFYEVLGDAFAYRLYFRKMSWIQAQDYCKNISGRLFGRLAELTDPAQVMDGRFLMIQKRADVNVVWVGGRYNNDKWNWVTYQDPIEPTETYVKKGNCMGFDQNHIRFGMECMEEHSFICQYRLRDYTKYANTPLRNRTKTHSMNITELPDIRKLPYLSSWKQLGHRLYKAFTGSVTIDDAKEKCFMHHPDAQLAVLLPDNVKFLTNMISEGSWLGAHWSKDAYTFESEPIILSNQTDSSGFPPWGTSPEGGDCVYLDRSDRGPAIYESSCSSRRDYICYTQHSYGSSDVMYASDAMRLYHNKKSWNEANAYCKNIYKEYKGKLAEMKGAISFDFIKMMLQNSKLAFRHFWLGGSYAARSDKEKTESDDWDDDLDSEKPSMTWISDSRHLSKDGDNCAVMDMHGYSYGVSCDFEMNFACEFSSDDYNRLLQDEAVFGKLSEF